MTLDEAIEYYIKVATQRAIADEEMGVNDKWNETKFMTKKESEQIIADNRQLAEWLTDYKELKNSIGAVKLSNMKEALELIREYKAENIAQKKLMAEYKRLLKAAIEDMSVTVAEVYNGGLICECCKWKSQIGECCCPDDGGCDVAYQWRYADETEKLIGENDDEP